MKEILDKISSYNIFNFLLPGVLFAVILDRTTEYSMLQENTIIGLFVYYFIGLIISRIGSLIVEPLMKKIFSLEFAKYSDFVKASSTDDKLDVLSETNNMYRTFISLFLILILVKAYELIPNNYTYLNIWVVLVFLVLLFAFSYRKQSKYIISRIDSRNKQNE